jgi:hypothetical protein
MNGKLERDRGQIESAIVDAYVFPVNNAQVSDGELFSGFVK